MTRNDSPHRYSIPAYVPAPTRRSPGWRRLFRRIVGIAIAIVLYHFYIHPWLLAQLSGALGQLPAGTPSLFANPAAAVQQFVGQIGPTLP